MRSALPPLLLIIVGCGCLGLSDARLQRHRDFLQTRAPGELLWSISLHPSQCPNGVPCFNIYAVNQTQGELNWFAYSTNSQGIKGFSAGKHAIYYSTWSGPGLYAVRATSGHVRWQFPLENWFKYWVKDIDLPAAASFSEANEVKDVVFVTAAGPPSRLYALKTKTGARLWEFMAPNSSVEVADLAMPAFVSTLKRRLLFVALNAPASNTSWVTALDVASGSSVWQSEQLAGVQLEQLELDGCCRLLATSRTANTLLALNVSNGRLLWRRNQQYCAAPSPVAVPYYSGKLLLPSSCDVLSGLALVDSGSGQAIWGDWDVPSDAVPVGNCTWMAVKDGAVVFGCSCSIQSKRRKHHGHGAAAAAAGPLQAGSGAAASSQSRQQEQEQKQEQQDGQQRLPRAAAGAVAAAGRLLQQTAAAAAAAAEPDKPGLHQQGVCLYSVRVRSGKLDWVLPVSGNLSFPEAAQAWGAAPLLHQGMAIFLAATQVLAVDSFTGRVAWLLHLSEGESVHSWLQPALDPLRNVLLIPAQRGTNRTAISAVNVADGKLLWRKLLNGTGQVPVGGPGAGEAQRLLLEGDRLYLEACKSMTCCLRALHVLTGKQVWGVCLDAAQGQDATHPRAQFAIWLITLVTIGSICLLILGACMVYVHRWSEERAILFGQDEHSPRHTYRPLPDGNADSDSEGEEAEAQAARQRGSFISSLRQAQAAGIGGRSGSSSAARQPVVQQGVVMMQSAAGGAAAYVPVSALPAAAAAARSRQHLPRVGWGGEEGAGRGGGGAWLAAE